MKPHLTRRFPLAIGVPIKHAFPGVFRHLPKDITSKLMWSLIRYSCILLGPIFLSISWGCSDPGSESGSKTLRITVVPKSTNNVFWRNVHGGVMKAAHELEVSIDWQGAPKETDRQQQVSIVQNFISRNMDAIVLAPSDSRSMVKVVRDAGRAGIPVIIFDSGLESNDYISFVATNNYKGGQLCADRLVEILEGNKVIMLRHNEGSASTSEREEGFLDRIKEIMPDVDLISTNQYGGVSVEKALQVSQNLLNRFSEIDSIFCPSEPTTQAVLRALQIAGKEKQIKFVGFDANTGLVDGLKKEEIQGLALQDPFGMGYLAVKTAVQHVRGEKVDERIETGVYMITPENMDQEEMQLLLKPPVKQWLEE